MTRVNTYQSNESQSFLPLFLCTVVYPMHHVSLTHDSRNCSDTSTCVNTIIQVRNGGYSKGRDFEEGNLPPFPFAAFIQFSGSPAETPFTLSPKAKEAIDSIRLRGAFRNKNTETRGQRLQRAITTRSRCRAPRGASDSTRHGLEYDTPLLYKVRENYHSFSAHSSSV